MEIKSNLYEDLSNEIGNFLDGSDDYREYADCAYKYPIAYIFHGLAFVSSVMLVVAYIVLVIDSIFHGGFFTIATPPPLAILLLLAFNQVKHDKVLILLVLLLLFWLTAIFYRLGCDLRHQNLLRDLLLYFCFFAATVILNIFKVKTGNRIESRLRSMSNDALLKEYIFNIFNFHGKIAFKEIQGEMKNPFWLTTKFWTKILAEILVSSLAIFVPKIFSTPFFKDINNTDEFLTKWYVLSTATVLIVSATSFILRIPWYVSNKDKFIAVLLKKYMKDYKNEVISREIGTGTSLK